jgi:hypothetical protein
LFVSHHHHEGWYEHEILLHVHKQSPTHSQQLCSEALLQPPTKGPIGSRAKTLKCEYYLPKCGAMSLNRPHSSSHNIKVPKTLKP